MTTERVQLFILIVLSVFLDTVASSCDPSALPPSPSMCVSCVSCETQLSDFHTTWRDSQAEEDNSVSAIDLHQQHGDLTKLGHYNTAAGIA